MILEKEMQQIKWMIQFHSDVFKKYNLTIQQYDILG